MDSIAIGDELLQRPLEADAQRDYPCRQVCRGCFVVGKLQCRATIEAIRRGGYDCASEVVRTQGCSEMISAKCRSGRRRLRRGQLLSIAVGRLSCRRSRRKRCSAAVTHCDWLAGTRMGPTMPSSRPLLSLPTLEAFELGNNSPSLSFSEWMRELK